MPGVEELRLVDRDDLRVGAQVLRDLLATSRPAPPRPCARRGSRRGEDAGVALVEVRLEHLDALLRDDARGARGE